MKVLVATKKMQGRRKNDFSHTTDGELVVYGFECDGERVDGKCGCKRCLIGIESRKGTTTFEVATKDIDEKTVYNMIVKHLCDCGWIHSVDNLSQADKKFVDGQWQDIRNLYRAFSAHPDGTVLERRGNSFGCRLDTIH